MSRGIIFLLLLCTILFSACGSSNASSAKTSANKKSVITVPNSSATKPVSGNEKQRTNNNSAESKGTDNKNSTKVSPLTSAEKAKISNEINPALSSIDDVLNSLDDAKELNVN